MGVVGGFGVVYCEGRLAVLGLGIYSPSDIG